MIYPLPCPMKAPFQHHSRNFALQIFYHVNIVEFIGTGTNPERETG